MDLILISGVAWCAWWPLRRMGPVTCTPLGVILCGLGCKLAFRLTTLHTYTDTYVHGCVRFVLLYCSLDFTFSLSPCICLSSLSLKFWSMTIQRQRAICNSVTHGTISITSSPTAILMASASKLHVGELETEIYSGSRCYVSEWQSSVDTSLSVRGNLTGVVYFRLKKKPDDVST